MDEKKRGIASVLHTNKQVWVDLHQNPHEKCRPAWNLLPSGMGNRFFESAADIEQGAVL